MDFVHDCFVYTFVLIVTNSFEISLITYFQITKSIQYIAFQSNIYLYMHINMGFQLDVMQDHRDIRKTNLMKEFNILIILIIF